MCTTAFLALFGINYIDIFTVQHGGRVGEINLISAAWPGSDALQYTRVSHANYATMVGYLRPL